MWLQRAAEQATAGDPKVLWFARIPPRQAVVSTEAKNGKRLHAGFFWQPLLPCIAGGGQHGENEPAGRNGGRKVSGDPSGRGAGPVGKSGRFSRCPSSRGRTGPGAWRAQGPARSSSGLGGPAAWPEAVRQGAGLTRTRDLEGRKAKEGLRRRRASPLARRPRCLHTWHICMAPPNLPMSRGTGATPPAISVPPNFPPFLPDPGL